MKLDPHRIYRECLGNISLRQAWQDHILAVYHDAEERGRLSDSYKRLLQACYKAAGGDIDSFWSDEDPGDLKVRDENYYQE